MAMGSGLNQEHELAPFHWWYVVLGLTLWVVCVTLWVVWRYTEVGKRYSRRIHHAKLAERAASQTTTSSDAFADAIATASRAAQRAAVAAADAETATNRRIAEAAAKEAAKAATYAVDAALGAALTQRALLPRGKRKRAAKADELQPTEADEFAQQAQDSAERAAAALEAWDKREERGRSGA